MVHRIYLEGLVVAPVTLFAVPITLDEPVSSQPRAIYYAPFFEYLQYQVMKKNREQSFCIFYYISAAPHGRRF